MIGEDLEAALHRVAEADCLVVAMDFDGTLSPIVAQHDEARPDPRALESFFALARLPGTRGLVISGRARSDLESRLGPDRPPEVALIGSHGAEEDPAMTDFSRPEARSHGVQAPEVAAFREGIRGIEERFPGTRLEPKPFSLAVHYRGVEGARQGEARRWILHRLEPLARHVTTGKKVLEFFAVEADKGRALLRYRERLRSLRPGAADDAPVVFVGDDVTDESGFRALGPGDVTVKVGGGETAARYRISDQPLVASVLHRLLVLRREAGPD